MRDVGEVWSECEVRLVVMCLNRSLDEEEETSPVVLYKIEYLNLQPPPHSSRYAFHSEMPRKPQFYDATILMMKKQPPQSPFLLLVAGKKGVLLELNNIKVWGNNISGWELRHASLDRVTQSETHNPLFNH